MISNINTIDMINLVKTEGAIKASKILKLRASCIIHNMVIIIIIGSNSVKIAIMNIKFTMAKMITIANRNNR